jgi:hypothetical protein
MVSQFLPFERCSLDIGENQFCDLPSGTCYSPVYSYKKMIVCSISVPFPICLPRFHCLCYSSLTFLGVSLNNALDPWSHRACTIVARSWEDITIGHKADDLTRTREYIVGGYDDSPYIIDRYRIYPLQDLGTLKVLLRSGTVERFLSSGQNNEECDLTEVEDDATIFIAYSRCIPLLHRRRPLHRNGHLSMH